MINFPMMVCHYVFVCQIVFLVLCHRDRPTMRALKGRVLRPSHLVVADSLAYLVEEGLANLRPGRGAWAKGCEVLEETSDFASAGGSLLDEDRAFENVDGG